MASGISSPWGLSPQMVAGINNSLDFGNQHLTGELNLTSITPTYEGGYISPLTYQNSSYYKAPSKIAFGKKRKINDVDSDILYLKRSLKKR